MREPGQRSQEGVERSTLDQAGTKPFHLKRPWHRALIGQCIRANRRSRDLVGLADKVDARAKSARFSRDRNRGRRQRLAEKRRRLSPRVAARDSCRTDQTQCRRSMKFSKSENSRSAAPDGATNIGWVTNTGTAEVRNILRSYVALRDSTGLLLYAGGFGWGGSSRTMQTFVGEWLLAPDVGTPQVTAKVTTLEILQTHPRVCSTPTPRAEIRATTDGPD